MLLLACFCCRAFAADLPPGIATNMSLRQALVIALDRNSKITYYSMSTNIAGNSLGYHRARFLPSLNATAQAQQQDYGSENINNYDDTYSDQYTLYLSRENTLGGTSSLGFSSVRDKTSYSTSESDNDEYTSEFYLSYEQPLLRGAGPSVAAIDVKKAELNYALSMEEYQDGVEKTLFDVIHAYFELYRTGQEIRLKKEIRDNTKKIHDIVAEKVKMKKLPMTDLNRIKNTLYVRDRQILDLENLRRLKERNLLIAVCNETCTGPETEINTTTVPDDLIDDLTDPDMRKTIDRRLETDFMLVRLRFRHDTLEKDLRKAADDRLPEFNLGAEVGIEGYDATDRGGSVSDISPENHRVLLTGALSLPVINTRANSRYAETAARLRRLEIEIANREYEVERLVKDLLDNIATARKKMDLNEKIVDISKDNLEKEIERLVAEKSTVLDTLDYQTEYLNAQLDMLNTKIDFVNVIATYYLYMRKLAGFARVGNDGHAR